MTKRRLQRALTLGSAIAAIGFVGQQATGETAPKSQNEVRVKLIGIGETKGDIRVALFDSAEAFENGKQFAGNFMRVTGSEMLAVFAVPAGTWGISSFHDVNGNGKLDTNMLGIPNEPFAFSNNARGKFGPPKFENLSFSVGDGPVALEMDFR